MKKREEPEESIWGLRVDLASAKALLWVGLRSESSDLRPEVHLYLYDRYWRLGVCHEKAGRIRKAREFKARAEHHWRLWGGGGPPVAVATAMRPQRPSARTLAFGGSGPQSSDDDAA